MRNRLLIKIFKLTLIYVVIFVILQLVIQHNTSKYASFAEEQLRYVFDESDIIFSCFPLKHNDPLYENYKDSDKTPGRDSAGAIAERSIYTQGP